VPCSGELLRFGVDTTLRRDVEEAQRHIFGQDSNWSGDLQRGVLAPA
jgi:hypothetical protein